MYKYNLYFRDIYTRLKALEDRLLTVESASPEYTSLMNINQAVCRANGRPRSNSAAIYVEKVTCIDMIYFNFLK